MGFLLIRFLLYPTRYYVMRVLCLLILLPLLSMSQNNQSDIIYWVEGSINNSYSYDYSPPNYNWTPFTNIRPIGMHTQSLYGYGFSLGIDKNLKQNFNFNLGIEVEFTKNRIYMNVDSVKSYYDTTGFLYYHDNINTYTSFQIPVSVSYNYKSLYTSIGVSIPLYIGYHATHNSILGLNTHTANDWIWSLKFPSMLVRIRAGWSFLPKWCVFLGYSKYSSNSFLSSRLFFAGLKYYINESSTK